MSEEALAIAVQKSIEIEERLGGQLQELEAAVAALRAENAELRSRLGDAESSAEQALSAAEARAAEAERYQAGLERAVGELNRVAAQPPQTVYIDRPTRPAAKSRVATLRAPEVNIVDRNVLVTGKLWNPGDADGIGSIVVELLLNGRVVTSKEQRLDVPARTDVAWSQSFYITPSDGTYSARVRLHY